MTPSKKHWSGYPREMSSRSVNVLKHLLESSLLVNAKVDLEV